MQSISDPELYGGRTILSIAPADTALANCIPDAISVQNQIRGTVKHILHTKGSFYVTVDCGIYLIAEITPESLYDLDVKLNN